jgi:hypothetical protein
VVAVPDAAGLGQQLVDGGGGRDLGVGHASSVDSSLQKVK